MAMLGLDDGVLMVNTAVIAAGGIAEVGAECLEARGNIEVLATVAVAAGGQ
jgi:hypothetical protein